MNKNRAKSTICESKILSKILRLLTFLIIKVKKLIDKISGQAKQAVYISNILYIRGDMVCVMA